MAENTKYYLDQVGLEKLVEYIKTELSNKVSKGEQVVLPPDLVKIADLEPYATKVTLNDYAKLSDIPAEPDLSVYATNAALDTAINEVRAQVSGVYHFRGNVDNLAALQLIENPAEGDVYNIVDTGMNAAWNGEAWDDFGTVVDLSPYAKSEDIQALSVSEINRIIYSGKSGIVTDRDGINAMLANNEPIITITLNKNLNVVSPINIPEGKEVTLDLDGNEISGATPITANGGTLIIKNGSVRATSGAAVIVNNGGLVTVDNADIVSVSDNAIAARDGEVIMNSGSVTAQEAGILGLKNSVITVNGGTITGVDNCPIMGNGSAAGSANDGSNMNVIMNGGTLVAHIQSDGYVACGVYVPNSGSFTMNGGEIISDGAGIVMRAGQVNLNGGSVIANGETGIKGKVGDSRVVVGSYAVVYDAASSYPAKDTLELNIGSNMLLQGTDGDINYIPNDGTANVTDNR